MADFGTGPIIPTLLLAVSGIGPLEGARGRNGRVAEVGVEGRGGASRRDNGVRLDGVRDRGWGVALRVLPRGLRARGISRHCELSDGKTTEPGIATLSEQDVYPDHC